MKVLIADDSIVSRHVLEATLRKWGYDVVIAADGEQAWNILSGENPPSLAIVDWMMPGMTGVELCRRIRQAAREPYTYILLLTSKNLRDDLIEGMEAGADDYISKPFDHHELEVRLRAGKRLAELHAELVNMREALREQATKDSLTQVWNRSSILDILDRELARSMRQASPVGVVLLDLDHFKSVNDQHGHFAGDAVLRESAGRMHKSIRTYDAIGRYGGEEFLILLPGCDEQTTFAQAERLRVMLSDPIVAGNDLSLRITGSFGCTSSPPGGEIPPEALVRKADEALYLAKRRGRDRVELLSSSPEPSPRVGLISA